MSYLKTYCEFFSGYSFRNSTFNADTETFRVINLKDFNTQTGEIDYLNLSTTDELIGSHKHVLQDGDVLLISKGNDNSAVQFQKDNSDLPVVAAGAFIVLRPMKEYLDPSYLACYLNLKVSQSFFKRSLVGTTVRNLSIGTLHEFEIKVPPLQTQQTVGELYLLSQEEKRVYRQREEKWTLLFNEQIKNIL